MRSVGDYQCFGNYFEKKQIMFLKVLIFQLKKCVLSQRFCRVCEVEIGHGEMSEWFKEHAWKVCVLQKGTAGSNPALSANN